MRTCLTCARFVYQEAELGVGVESDVHVVIRCARDRFALRMDQADEVAFKKALNAAEKCDQYYEAAALGVEGT